MKEVASFFFFFLGRFPLLTCSNSYLIFPLQNYVIFAMFSRYYRTEMGSTTFKPVSALFSCRSKCQKMGDHCLDLERSITYMKAPEVSAKVHGFLSEYTSFPPQQT